ncbi:MAG TPA: PEP-CTERM sorting domain-containing protein [Tepidisphaeraceae bacterium]|nr:PEP-CTERM sorting domain-containing protein [Tepidisphaeraceae bacterium]
MSRTACLAACAFLGFSTTITSAAIFTPLSSGTESRFGSQSNGYTDSNPLLGAWGAPGFGTYPPGLPLPGLPGLPPLNMQHPITGGLPFQSVVVTSTFADNLAGTTSFTASQSDVTDAFVPFGTQTQDVGVQIPTWRFVQGPAAPGYAYHQINFGAAYHVTTNPGLTGSTPNFPYVVGGVIKAPGAYAQFELVQEYTWTPVNTALTPTGPTVSLGQLSVSVIATGVGPFLFTPSTTGALLPAPAGDGVLEIHGFAYIAGDPFEMYLNNAVPEPTTLALMMFTGLMTLRRRVVS